MLGAPVTAGRPDDHRLPDQVDDAHRDREVPGSWDWEGCLSKTNRARDPVFFFF